MLDGGDVDASATTMVTATDTSERMVAFPIKCQQSNKSPEEEEQYRQMCLRLNKMKEEEEARANQWSEQMRSWKFVNRVGGAVMQQEAAPVHSSQVPKKQPQPIPTSQGQSNKPSDPQPHHPNQTRVKQQVSSVEVREGEREGGKISSNSQPQSFPHPQHPPSAVIPPSAPEVFFEKEVTTTAPIILSTAADVLKLDQLILDDVSDVRRRKREQEAADEAFAR